MDQSHIRNFCIIAHIDHGKSTLADRFLEMTGTVEKRKMQEQLLDKMELERERGITIKLKPVRMIYTRSYAFVLNLIDTPGHVDFTYEVSRSLAAVEGAILLVDATQGIQAQTLANLHLAQRQGLTIIPVLNKIDLPNADVPRRRGELARLVNSTPEDVLAVSAKTGEGVREVLDAVIERVPHPQSGMPNEDVEHSNYGNVFRALIFDSQFDEFRGVVAYVRVFDGTLKKHDTITLAGTDTEAEVLFLGYLRPNFIESESLNAGEIGYVITNVKEITKCRVGDTMLRIADERGLRQRTNAEKNPSTISKKDLKDLILPGYQEAKPMVYAGLFPVSSDEYQKLRSALEKLQLTDASLHFEPEHSKALGFGFRCGFLGLLHLDIIKERINREFDIELVITVPSVGYHLFLTSNPKEFELMTSAEEYADPSKIDHIEEPIVHVRIVVPQTMIGKVMGLFERYVGEYSETLYPSDTQAILGYLMPLSEILVDFHDSLKSATAGYASMSYEFFGYQRADVAKMDILVNTERVEALSMIVYKSRAYEVGKRIVEKLKENMPRQMFEQKLQATIGGKVVASERLSAMRKDVTAKLSGGDDTRRRKLLEKQKKGKKKMLAIGKISIPQNVYLEILKR